MSADPNAQPTKPELAILKLLWRRKALSARAISDEIAESLGWSYSTLRTVLERMFEKGLLSKSHQDGVNVYGARVGKIALLGRMIQDFSDRVLEMDAAPSAVMFADSKLLTEDELEELEKVLHAEGED
ncbi:MAG: BlaI/MecI/CopY family transcriptional regulator [Pseudomonadota bacterium]